MNKLNLFEWNATRNFLNEFTDFAINNEKMNYIRGGGDPVPPPYGGSEPDWQDDEPKGKTPTAP